MTKLTNNQKKFLRSKGHSLKPVVMLGQHGLTEGVLAELASSLETHELLKIKVRGDDREDKQRIIDEIIKTTQAHLVQVIGNIMVIYRAFDEDPQLILPRK
ncbi:ribosome assembly RNA-binding protein YhbY [Candidatus Thioglobus sp.]|mgnify:FL=1|jgi:RNA-binding protein|uniref:ribosome assembly RNA-binding protein YhbY n=1 Tax=Candidatus Thioglobus sp. TaxID=2026721 RepID=UPI001D854C03|nr:ribosome assembly RNA-binding protein YhbY [Candidatus Thioglobus sp.]MBT3277392.1 ribosome assembly RNA-binding protein YhbY [Candidatus Thioglobus sp.]MBT3446583.1 ribosome assembly RNA-binding protein YhbY [Candidatus Thioglobus sp.]MBT3744964.1 ribosome assembly RNA-binding protein YhbY [Candidatus Thioglobus sp.]MBT4000726.1 ribosome assembly RNA-binding protein YhbY [Candidatus Thioglobus sp.]MBT4181882.1 ribosome assembly RNA-binding protein YhbY [Candidatus Thioglobus sp.]